MRLMSVALLPLVALMQSSCGAFDGAYMTDKGINLPNMPATIEAQGKVVKIPKGPLNDKQVKTLLANMRHSELSNAYAVQDAVKFYKGLKQSYSRKTY